MNAQATAELNVKLCKTESQWCNSMEEQVPSCTIKSCYFVPNGYWAFICIMKKKKGYFCIVLSTEAREVI